tara:strand:- start:18643 stop:20046 length:1404 start_codon:yes stop_codon:yes gene_type:complete
MNKPNKKHKNTSIEVNSVSKQYRIYGRKRDWVKQIIGDKSNKYYKEIDALDNVSLSVKKGEIYGIVGKNGSGKSTLLQIICGTTSASEGCVRTNGKIAALLELGSGFDPEFSGRENIYLNAMLMGLTKKQVDERIDKIIEFADIGDYIEKPIRTYSSGMIVRVAFAVITNVEADILIIDEALAVGDAYFTQKCMRFIQRFKENGTILFVSHDSNAVISLCDKAILLDKGNKIFEGTPKDVIEKYTKDLRNSEEEANKGRYANKSGIGKRRQKDRVLVDKKCNYELEWFKNHMTTKREEYKLSESAKFDKELDNVESFGGKQAKIVETKLSSLNDKNEELRAIDGGELVKLVIRVRAKDQINNIILGFLLKNDKGLILLGDNTGNPIGSNKYNVDRDNIITAEFIFTMPLLPKGEYSVTSSVAEGTLEKHNILHWVNDSIILTSQCTSIAAGLAGVAMHSIKLSNNDS